MALADASAETVSPLNHEANVTGARVCSRVFKTATSVQQETVSVKKRPNKSKTTTATPNSRIQQKRASRLWYVDPQSSASVRACTACAVHLCKWHVSCMAR